MFAIIPRYVGKVGVACLPCPQVVCTTQLSYINPPGTGFFANFPVGMA